jgi:hypothetical protein
MSLLSLCNASAVIQAATTTSGAIGGHTTTFATAQTISACTIQPAKGRTIEEYAKRSIHIDHTLYTPEPITATLTPGSRVTSGGITYLVQAGPFDQAGRARVYAIHLLKKG